MVFSPLGKVPILLVEDNVIFESHAICEYLDEVYSPTLSPVDPLIKAKNRAWIEYASTLNASLFMLALAKDQNEAEKNIALCKSQC